MRNFTILLGMLAVLLMAGSASACPPGAFYYDGLQISVERTEGFNVPGLRSYLIRLGGRKAFANIQIWDGAGQPLMVSQANKFELVWDEETETEVEQTIPTPWLISMPPVPKSVDTHFMFAMPGTVLPGSTFSETNDKSNPGHVMSPSSGYYAGLGTFTSVGGFAFAQELPMGTPFVQVVVPNDSGIPVLRIMTPIHGVDTYIDKWFYTIPEPGSIAMLVVGALCLVAMRVRKKRAG